jgi:RNA polymerase sigma factor (sigma-70 family)
MSPASGSTALDMLVREEDLTRMRVALPRLSADDRELLDRCYIGGETVTAIAASTGEPAERLRKRKSRALSRLRELLGCSRDASHESARSSMEEQ